MTPAPPAAVSIRGLVVRYGATTAVEGLELDVRPGELFGLLGPNGAGKTTTMRVLTTLLRPTEGSVSVGTDRRPPRRRQRGLRPRGRSVRALSHVNPLSYEVEALRGLLLHTPARLGIDLLVLAGAAATGIGAASALLPRLTR